MTPNYLLAEDHPGFKAKKVLTSNARRVYLAFEFAVWVVVVMLPERSGEARLCLRGCQIRNFDVRNS